MASTKDETAASAGIVAKVMNSATEYVQKLKPGEKKEESIRVEPAASSNDIVDSTVEEKEGPGEEKAGTFTEMLKTELPAKIEEMKNNTENEDKADGGEAGDVKKVDAGLTK